MGWKKVILQKVLCTKPGGNGDKRRGRPKLRWYNELEEDIAEVGCLNWRISMQSRDEWRKLTEVTSCPDM